MQSDSIIIVADEKVGGPCAPRAAHLFDRMVPAKAARSGRRGFTLVEVLAALLLMAIVIPVALQGMSVASRAAIMGQRKAAAMRVAERMLNELIVTGQMTSSTASGSLDDGDTAYPWSMESAPWPEDAMTQVTVRVTFTVQGNSYDVSASTLFDATSGSTTTAGTTIQ